MRSSKRLLRALRFALMACACALGQSPTTADNPTLNSVTFPVYTLNAAPVPGATIRVVGQAGQATWYFWASANFQLGSIVSAIGSITNAPNTLTSSNYVSIIPNSYPAGVLTVDILATTKPLAPSGVCNCAVATGLTGGGTNFQSNTLSSYTVALLNPQAFQLVLRNEVTGTGAVSLMLRNAYTGALICNLSTACGASSPIQTATVTLSSAQLKNLIAVNPTLVAAQGSGTYINLIGIVLDYKAGNVAYTLNGQSTFQVGHAGALAFEGFDWTQSIAPFSQVGLDTTNNSVLPFGFPSPNNGYPTKRSSSDNSPVILALGNTSGSDLTDGNGTVTVTAYYTVVTLQ